jgi:ATP-dependent Zn protease
MKFATTAVMSLLLAEQSTAFVPFSPIKTSYKTSAMSMALDTPPPAIETPDLPVIQRNQYGPTDIRYSDFLKLVNKDKIEKVTFSADGTQLLGVDEDGTRLKIESLPNDPDLLTQLTSHKVRLKLFCLHILRTAITYTFVTLMFPFTLNSCQTRLMLLSFLSKKPAVWGNLRRVLFFQPLFSLDCSF